MKRRRLKTANIADGRWLMAGFQINSLHHRYNLLHMTTTTAVASKTAATPNYTLSLNDLSAWTNILSMQIKTRPDAIMDDTACSDFAWWILGFTMPKRPNWNGGGWSLQDNTPVYSIISNSDLRSWTNDLFVELGKVQVPAYKRPYYEVYTGWLCTYLFTMFQVRVNCENVGGWSDLVLGTAARWNYVVTNDLERVVQLNMAACSNPDALKVATSSVASDQLNALNVLMKLKELTAEQCMYLMYLLLSLTTGNAAQQNMVQKVVSASCSSMELANSNLITALVYYNLMQFADPLGPYAQPNPQILAILNGLLAYITGADAGSTALKAALATQVKILTVSANYPMVDPYYPGIGFNTRLSDMLNAINDSWAQINS